MDGKSDFGWPSVLVAAGGRAMPAHRAASPSNRGGARLRRSKKAVKLSLTVDRTAWLARWAGGHAAICTTFGFA